MGERRSAKDERQLIAKCGLLIAELFERENGMPQRNNPHSLQPHSLELVASAVGKSSGTGSVTQPVAAHSVPRSRVVVKPTQRIE